MECKVSELVKRGHDQEAELKSSCGAVDVRDVAQLISDLATHLDVQLARSNALAAENAALKSDQVRIFNSGYQRGHEATVEGYYVDIHQNDMTTYHEDIVAEILEEQAPQTDTFLAEVRAQESKRVYESILDNPAVTDMESLVDWLEQNANDSVAFAAQLRKGVQS